MDNGQLLAFFAIYLGAFKQRNLKTGNESFEENDDGEKKWMSMEKRQSSSV